MDPLQPAVAGEIAQVAPDRVLGGAEFLGEGLRDDLPVGRQATQDELLALGRQHDCMNVHEYARKCTTMRHEESAMTTDNPSLHAQDAGSPVRVI